MHTHVLFQEKYDEYHTSAAKNKRRGDQCDSGADAFAAGAFRMRQQPAAMAERQR